MTLRLGSITQITPTVLLAADGSTVGMPVSAFATDGTPQVNDRVVFDEVDGLVVVLANLTGVRDGIPGEIRMFGASTAPNGWLACNGAAVSRTTFARLFAIVGTTYGAGNGTSTFNVPNFANNFPMGNTPGNSGGASTHTHTSAAHSHALAGTGFAGIEISSGSFNLKRNVASGFTGTRVINGGGGQADTATAAVAAADLIGNTGSTTPGSTGSASSLPPFVGALFIIKT